MKDNDGAVGNGGGEGSDRSTERRAARTSGLLLMHPQSERGRIPFVPAVALTKHASRIFPTKYYVCPSNLREYKKAVSTGRFYYMHSALSLHRFSVLCFSANSTILRSTNIPFRSLTPSIYPFATFDRSAFSPRSSSSSSVVGTQKGS